MPARRSTSVARQEILHAPIPAQSDDVRMLDEDKLIRNTALLALFHQFSLQSEGLGIPKAAEIANFTSTHHGPHALIVSPYTLLNASPKASYSVG